MSSEFVLQHGVVFSICYSAILLQMTVKKFMNLVLLSLIPAVSISNYPYNCFLVCSLFQFQLSKSIIFSAVICVPHHSPRFQLCPLSIGALNISKCQGGAPVFVSLPHFLSGEYYQNLVTGLSPDREKHGTYLDVETVSKCDSLSASLWKERSECCALEIIVITVWCLLVVTAMLLSLALLSLCHVAVVEGTP